MEVAHGRAEGLLHDWVDAVEVLLTTRAHTVTQVLHAGRVRDKSFKHSAIFNRLAHGISALSVRCLFAFVARMHDNPIRRHINRCGQRHINRCNPMHEMTIINYDTTCSTAYVMRTYRVGEVTEDQQRARLE